MDERARGDRWDAQPVAADHLPLLTRWHLDLVVIGLAAAAVTLVVALALHDDQAPSGPSSPTTAVPSATSPLDGSRDR